MTQIVRFKGFEGDSYTVKFYDDDSTLVHTATGITGNANDVFLYEVDDVPDTLIGRHSIVLTDEADSSNAGTLWVNLAGSASTINLAQASLQVDVTYTYDTDSSINQKAQHPRKVVTDEGTVVERSVQELILAADRENAENVGDTPLHGLRVSRFKPGTAAW